MLQSAGDYSVDISGGRIDNGFRFGAQSGVSHFNMTGGEIYGGFVKWYTRGCELFRWVYLRRLALEQLFTNVRLGRRLACCRRWLVN